MSLFDPAFDRAPYRRTGDKLREMAFPLGGIGTGCVSLDGRGGLRDWEIYGRPNKGSVLDYTFPALWVQPEGEEPVCRTLLGPRQSGWMGREGGFWNYGHGRFFEAMDGLPGFSQVEFDATFPVARLKFLQPGFPLGVGLASLSSFIPQDVEGSSWPVAQLIYRLSNPLDKPVKASLAWSLMNPVAVPEGQEDKSFNQWVDEGSFRGILFANDPEAPDAGEVILGTTWGEVDFTVRWKEQGWWDSVRSFWTRFRQTGRLDPEAEPGSGARMPGSLALRVKLAPGESAELPFFLVWRFPNREREWDRKNGVHRWQAHYATRWDSAAAVARDLASQQEGLRSQTLAYEEALFGSSLPAEVIESVASTASILETPTVIRLEGGEFWAWEGCSGQAGCCDGTCSHVWNYALTHAYLFPEIQRSFLESAFAYGFLCGPEGEEGAMKFRQSIPLHQSVPLWHAASDGQLGQIVQVYRDWKLTGDREWLAGLWPQVKKALAYAWVQWDRDRDGLVEGDQHNTYDINFQGPNPLTQFFYLAALKAAAELAEAMGEESGEYRRLLASGQKLTEQKLWNGEYFEQEGQFVDPESPRHQHGKGCLSDALFGQLCATVAGLGTLVEPGLVRKGLQAIWRHNFRDPLGDHENLQRVYAWPDESGLLLCTWPRGEIPAYPFVYSDEVWTGIEYQVASHLAFEGFKEEALEVVRALRARHDGARRNPLNEYECGSHYARALASYGLLLAWTGCRFEAQEKTLSFTTQPFRSFWSIPGAWGRAERSEAGELKVEVLGGSLPEGVVLR